MGWDVAMHNACCQGACLRTDVLQNVVDRYHYSAPQSQRATLACLKVLLNR